MTTQTLPTTIEGRKMFLDNILAKGKVASVQWTKKDGSLRKASIIPFSEKHLSSGDRDIVQPSSTAHIKKYQKYFEMAGVKSKWCTIDLSTLSSVTFQKQTVTA